MRDENGRYLVDYHPFGRGAGCLVASLMIGAAAVLPVMQPTDLKLFGEVALLVALAVGTFFASGHRSRLWVEGGALRVWRTAWPLSSFDRSIPLKRIREVVLEGYAMDWTETKERRACTLLALLDTGERVRLVNYSGRYSAEADLARIRAALAGGPASAL